MADLKTRMGRISQTRRSLVNLPQGSTNLDPADLQSPLPRQYQHNRHSSRVDVISEKEELAAEENSLSQQEKSEMSGIGESNEYPKTVDISK